MTVAATCRGLPANIIGIMPEKTIKLAGNDFFRGVFKVDDPKVDTFIPAPKAPRYCVSMYKASP